VLKKITQYSALLLAFSVFAVPMQQISAQSVVSGTNPMPTGEDYSSQDAMLILAGALSTM
jgi:hypothetical protein